jgi:signal peptidase II
VVLKKTSWIILIVAGLVVALDQGSKYLVTQSLPLGGMWSPFPGPQPFFQIVYTYNTGATFGLFKDLRPVFILIALVIVGVLILYARRLRSDQWLTCVALGLMLGGAIGNLIDRIRLGHVIDFIDVGVATKRWYTSNLADVSLVLGVILLGVAMLIEEIRHKPTPKPDNAAPSDGQS